MASMIDLKSIAATSTQSRKSIKDTFVDILKPLPKEQQLVELLDLFNKAVDLDEVISDIVSEAWYYLTTNQLWSLEYSDLKTLQRSIGYEQFVATALKKHGLDVVNKQTQAKGILKNWETPSRRSAGCKVCSLEEAISLLTSTVESRLLNPTLHSRSNHKTFLTPTDVQNVLNQLKGRRKELTEHQADEQISQRLQQNQDVTSRGVAHPLNRFNAFTPVNAKMARILAESTPPRAGMWGGGGGDEDNDEVDGEEDDAVVNSDEEEEQGDEQIENDPCGSSFGYQYQ
ncbi:MAG: hypothetical protein M1840_005295 [Geoglossum simile]|nr:MAG: hypothetical protein M1840_005295 [Geoglossum simile]